MYFQLEHWHWWVLTLIFVVTAAIFRGPIHISMTLATTAVGLLAWFEPEVPAKTQFLLCGLLTGVGIVVAQFVGNGDNKHPSSSANDPNFADQRSRDQDDSGRDDVIGRTFTLESPIVDGSGIINFDNQTWKLRGEDAAIGTKIKIESIDGIDKTFLEVSIVK